MNFLSELVNIWVLSLKIRPVLRNIKKIEIENTYLRMFCATLFWLFSINCIHFDNLEKCCMIDFMIALSC